MDLISFEDVQRSGKIFDASGIENNNSYQWYEKNNIFYPYIDTKKKLVKVIDTTPSWISILDTMLELNAKYCNADVDEYTPEMRANHDILKDNFKRMATAADAWVQEQKESEGTISIKWGVVDVIDRAKSRGIYISKEDAMTVLEDAKHNHDCNDGICWVTLDIYTDAIVSTPDGWERNSSDNISHSEFDLNWEDEDEVIGVLISEDNLAAIAVHASGRHSTNLIGTPCYGTIEQCISLINQQK